MTPSDIERVQKSFGLVAADADNAAGLFYHRLFTIAPESRALFSLPVTGQGQKFMQALFELVSGLDDIEATMRKARDLARRHKVYGVMAEHYAPFGAALIQTLRKGLGEAFDAETEQSWVEVYGLISAAMIDAAERDS